MLSSGVESLLDSSVSAVMEELYTGLPESISAELMAVPDPNIGLDGQADGSLSVLAHRDTLSAVHPWTSGVGNLCQQTEALGGMLEMISYGPAESPPEELLQAGGLEEDEENRIRNFRTVICSSNRYQREDEEAEGAEEYPAECYTFTPVASWSKQEDLNQHEVESSRACCFEILGSLRNTEENQANVQVTAETLPKLTEEVVQGMKADGTRIFGKAGYRNDRVSKGLPPESSQCPDTDTVAARAGVSESSILGFLEPLKVMDIGAARDHPQEINDYNGLKAHTAMPVRTGGNGLSVWETREEKLPRRNPLNEFSTSLVNCQTCQQDEENNAHDFCNLPIPKQNEPYRLSSVESCRTLSIPSSEIFCPVLKSSYFLDFRNMPLGNSSTAVYGVNNETPQKPFPQNMEHHIPYDHGTRFVENRSFTSVPAEQISVVRDKGLSTARTDPRGFSASIGKSYSSDFEEAAEVWRKITVGYKTEVCNQPEAQEAARSEHCHYSVFSSVASSSEEFSKEKFTVIPSEGNKLKKDQWQFSVSDLCKDDVKENSLLMEMSSIASHETGQRDIYFYNTSSKILPPSNHSCLHLSTKLDKDSHKTQLLEKESESNTASAELAGPLVEAAEADGSDTLSTGKTTNLSYTLNLTLPPVLQKSRQHHYNECPPCTAYEFSSKDKAQDNLSGKKSVGTSGTTGEQIAEVLLHRDKLKTSVSSRAFDNPNMTSKVFQRNMKSSVGSRDRVVTGLENEHHDTWNCNSQIMEDQCAAASTSWSLSRGTCVFLPNSQSFDVEFDKKIQATCLRDEISNKNMEVVQQWDLGKVTGSKIVCDRDKAKTPIGTWASQTDDCDKTRTVDSHNIPECHQRNKTSEELLVRYLNKNTCVDNFGFYNFPLDPQKRELGTHEEEEVSSLTANLCECSASICDTYPAPDNVNIPRGHANQTGQTLHPVENQCHACQSESDGPVPGSRQCLGNLTNQPTTGLQSRAGSVDETETDSSEGEEIVLKVSDNLPVLFHKYAKDSFEETLKQNVVDLGVRDESCSGYVGSIRNLIEGKTIKLKEHEECERDDTGILEESSSDRQPHCLQHACFIECAEEKAELVCAGNKMQQSLPKMELVEDQENTVSAQFLPVPSIHGSLSYKPENINELSDTENGEGLSVKSNACPQLTSEPGKETDAHKGIGPFHFGQFDVQESFNKTQMDSEAASALNSGISLPEKGKLCTSPENTQEDNHHLSSDKNFSKDSSMTKILSVKISVKRKSSSVEIPSSEKEMAPGFVNGARSSGVCAHSKESLKDVGHSMLTVKDMDVTSPKASPHEEKFKNTYKPENMNELLDTGNRGSLRINTLLSNSCPQFTSGPGKETDAQKAIGSSHFRQLDVREYFNKTWSDSEAVSALNSGISLPEKGKLCMSPESAQRDNCFSSSDKNFDKDSSMTKILSVTISVKRKSSSVEIPSSEKEMAPGFVNGAKSSGVCAHSRESLKDEGHSMLTVKDMDVTSPKASPCEEKLKNTCVEEKMGEVAPRKTLPRDCLWALLEDSRESDKIVPLSTESYGKVLEEFPTINLNKLSKERKHDIKLPDLAGTAVLPETVYDCQAEAVSDAKASPELQCNTTPTFYPSMSTVSDSCKESSPDCVVCSEARASYTLNAQSKGNVKEVTESQDFVPTHAICKKNQVLKQKKYEKAEAHLSDKAHQEQKLEHHEKAKITLQPSMSRSFEPLCSSSNEWVTSRNTKSEDPSEEIFAVRSSESKLCSTLQEVKRPKITTDIISSQFLKTQDSEMENLNLNLGYDGIPGAFGTKKRRTKVRGPLPLKIQPERTCKKAPTLHQLKTVRKIKKIESLPFFEIPLKIFPKRENTLLESLYSPCKAPTVETARAMRFVQMPRQRAKGCSVLNSLKLRKCTKEPALLSKLSAMASKLLAPAKSIHNLEPLPCSSEILPAGDRYSQRRSKNLLEAFSCINRNVHSRWADSWCTKMFSFQPLALYHVETTKIPFSDLSHKPPTSLDTPVSPISFHIKLESSPVRDLTGFASQHSAHHRPVCKEMPAPASKWTLSFLLSQSCFDTTASKEDSSLNNELHSSHSRSTQRTVALHPDLRRSAVAERRGGCSTLGLHTVLALSSPGCYRIWTRRRNLTSHIPTIQRLFISQFAQGLKRARCPTPVSDDFVSSLPYSLGRVLSIWSQHGPSACPSEITALHSNHCKWQPSGGIDNSSYAMLSHLPVQSMEALQTAGHEIRLETLFPLPFPKPRSLPESLPSPPRLPASELQVHALSEADASVPARLRSQDDTELKKTEPEKRPKKVSQIRIRKTVPKPDTNLTPMGLPKPKRLNKKEFSLEEIYTNKNYKSPPPSRSLETIFEEPKEKNGHLISVSLQKRKRILEFQDFTLPRKRKTRGKIKAVGSFTRAKRAALQSAELDVLLSQKLMDLEAFFAEEVE